MTIKKVYENRSSRFGGVYIQAQGVHILVVRQQAVRSRGVADLLRDVRVAQRAALHAVAVEGQDRVRQAHYTITDIIIN